MLKSARVLVGGMIVTVGIWALLSCATVATLPVVECTGTVTVRVLVDTIPTFSWVPTCTIARLIVEEGVEERWGTETLGPSTYESPIVYGVHPPGAFEMDPPQPLFLGHTYTVSVWRFFSVSPESLQLLGSANFTP